MHVLCPARFTLQCELEPAFVDDASWHWPFFWISEISLDDGISGVRPIVVWKYSQFLARDASGVDSAFIASADARHIWQLWTDESAILAFRVELGSDCDCEIIMDGNDVEKPASDGAAAPR